MYPSPEISGEPSEKELAAADAALDACMVSLGCSVGTDNEQIDADLDQAYADDHSDLYRNSLKVNEV